MARLEIAEAEAQHLAATIEQLGALGRLAHQARQAAERIGRLFPRLLLEIDARQRLQRARLHRQLRQHQLEVVARRLAVAELAGQLAEVAAQLGDALDVVERQEIEHGAQRLVGGEHRRRAPSASRASAWCAERFDGLAPTACA